MIRQRRRLYTAEDEATRPWRWFASPQAAEFWLDAAIKRKWYRKHSPIRHVKLCYPCKGNMASGVIEGNVLTINVPAPALHMALLIHELTHPIVGVTKGDKPEDHERDHGKRFAGALIEAYRHLDCAATADDLTAEFDERGVQWEEFK